jgi:aspartyl-tRNA(Asn)/glutamyl-tRNA(Gln) amidotransferase subunit C
MTALTQQEVEHIAELAKLALTDEEKARFREQLSAILDYARRLQSLDTGDIPPTASVLPVDTVLRPDQVRPPMGRERLMGSAPAQENGMFRVDVVLEEE